MSRRVSRSCKSVSSWFLRVKTFFMPWPTQAWPQIRFNDISAVPQACCMTKHYLECTYSCYQPAFALRTLPAFIKNDIQTIIMHRIRRNVWILTSFAGSHMLFLVQCIASQASAFMVSPMGLGAACSNKLSAVSPARRLAAPMDLKMVDIVSGPCPAYRAIYPSFLPLAQAQS